MVANPSDDPDYFNLEFQVDEKNLGIPIFEQAEISVTLDETTWDKWAQGGYSADNVEIDRETCRQIRITGSPAYLNNLNYDGQEKTLIALSFNFLTDEVDNQPEFDYRVIQRRAEDNATIGGELYRIIKPNRELFEAAGGEDKTISTGESVELEAESIGEPAYYNWYNETGVLIHSGTDFTVDPEVTTKYKLQVIAKNDGFVSYDEVVIQVKDYQIKSISPNPATTEISVDYFVKQGTSSAYFTVCPINSISSSNFIIDPTQQSRTINLSGMGTGSYYLRLVANGQVYDEKTFVVVQ